MTNTVSDWQKKLRLGLSTSQMQLPLSKLTVVLSTIMSVSVSVQASWRKASS